MTAHLSFRPARSPFESRLVRWGDDTGDLSIDVATEPGTGLDTVVAKELPVSPVAAAPSESVAYWRHAHALALVLIAEGRVRPTFDDPDATTWRIGGLDADRRRLIADTAAAMPTEARAIPVDADDPPLLHSAHALLRAYLDAVVNSIVSTESIPAEHLRAWDDLADEGIGEPLPLVLRIEHDEDANTFAATALVYDGRRLRSLADVWAGTDAAVRTRAMTALRDAEQVWPGLGAVLDDTTPGTIALTDADLTELLSGTADRLGSIGVEVHWPRHLAQTAVALQPRRGAGTIGGTIDFEWRVVLGGVALTDAEVAELADAARPVRDSTSSCCSAACMSSSLCHALVMMHRRDRRSTSIDR